MSFLRRLLGGDEPPADDVFQRLRAQVFSVTPDALSLAPAPGRPNVWAAIMEWSLDADVAMLVAIADGTVSLYFSYGGGIIGAGQHDDARRAAAAFLDAAESRRQLLVASRQTLDVERDHVRFHLRTFTGDMTAQVEEDVLVEGRHPLSGLWVAAQEVIAALRQLSPTGSAHVPDGPPPGTAMTLLTAAPPLNEEVVVSSSPDAAAIERAVREMAWEEISFVILRVDEDNLMAGSGAVNPVDGLSAKVIVDGEMHISVEAPPSLDVIIGLLQSYLAGDGQWREMIEWD